MTLLIDTSALILHFSSRHPFDLRDVCLPIYQEILQGVRDETAYRRIETSLEMAEFVENPMSHCLIAACAIRNNLTVLHHDRDYPNTTAVAALIQKRIA